LNGIKRITLAMQPSGNPIHAVGCAKSARQPSIPNSLSWVRGRSSRLLTSPVRSVAVTVG